MTLKETEYKYVSNELTLTTIDSLPGTGETVIKVPVKNGIPQTQDQTGEMDQWCLGDEYCFFLELK